MYSTLGTSSKYQQNAVARRSIVLVYTIALLQNVGVSFHNSFNAGHTLGNIYYVAYYFKQDYTNRAEHDMCKHFSMR